MAVQPRPRPIRVLNAANGNGEYDEETFRYFLAIEQARSARACQPIRLLLATVESESGESDAFPSSTAARLFDAMRGVLRDTDVVGWYQQDRIAAAVLTALPAIDESKIAQLEKRVTEDLLRRLPASVAASLRLRVVHRDVAERGTA